jgi:hypothetical protein
MKAISGPTIVVGAPQVADIYGTLRLLALVEVVVRLEGEERS